MKSACPELGLERLRGLQERANPELARLGMDYLDERLAAARDYPSSLWLAIAPHSPAGAVARMLGELHHSRAPRRMAAALHDALVHRLDDPRLSASEFHESPRFGRLRS